MLYFNTNVGSPRTRNWKHMTAYSADHADGASNDFRWKAVTFEGDGVHPQRLHRNHQIEIRALNVTMPAERSGRPATGRGRGPGRSV